MDGWMVFLRQKGTYKGIETSVDRSGNHGLQKKKKRHGVTSDVVGRSVMPFDERPCCAKYT
eukprot:scaffold537486_cov22-Prasinocladus_malaysianus.AAC.1